MQIHIISILMPTVKTRFRRIIKKFGSRKPDNDNDKGKKDPYTNNQKQNDKFKRDKDKQDKNKEEAQKEYYDKYWNKNL